MDDAQLELFNDETYWHPMPEPEPEPPASLELLQPESPPTGSINWPQLGFDNRERGKAAERAFRWEIQGLGGATSDPPEDPAGGTSSDIWVKFPHWEHPITVQVRSAVLSTDGVAEFKLGKKEGSQAGRDRRRQRRYYGRANLFALAVYEDDRITNWYLIPAKKLQKRVTLKVTPGRRALRRRKDWLEPEKYRGDRGGWLVFVDELKGSLQGILGS